MFVSSRRKFLELGALLLAQPALLSASSSETQSVMVSAASDADDKHWVVGLGLQNDKTQLLFKQELPERGHHVALSQRHGMYVALARRPGTWLVLGALAGGEPLAELRVPSDRHLYGHGVFSADENFFYTTESNFNDMEGDSGLLIEWAVVYRDGRPTLERAREFSTGGVGPHELLLMPDTDTLAVANGGIRTHPDSEREILNAESMLPSLVYLDRHSGRILEQQFLPQEFHQASIRHMDVSSSGQVAIGMQFQGEPWMQVPLLATHQRGSKLRLLSAPEQVHSRMTQYVGSVRFSRDGRHFAASCPNGNLLTFWDAASGELLHSTPSRDGCGVCAMDNGFVFSSGTGKVSWINPDSGAISEYRMPESVQVFWDNHLSMAGLA